MILIDQVTALSAVALWWVYGLMIDFIAFWGDYEGGGRVLNGAVMLGWCSEPYILEINYHSLSAASVDRR